MPILHADYEWIVKIIPDGSRVLDLGCGDGELLCSLIKRNKVIGMGVDIDEQNVLRCVQRGMTVVQGDIDEGLKEYPDKSYDYVVLNQTLQVTRRPEYVIKEMLRIGSRAIVSFPNFAHWKSRGQLFFRGCMPIYRMLPFKWYETPNIHILTIKDFRKFYRDYQIKILSEFPLISSRRMTRITARFLANLLAQEGIFVITAR